MAWPAWVLVICVVLALVLIAYGAVRAMSAARIVKNHVERMKAQPLLAAFARAQSNMQQINEDVAALDALLVRANAAIRTMNDGIAEMRIPQAVAAVRTAGAAIRLLFNHT
ncbi:MAG: hypothetical protein JO322_11210 [Candidatus Eremiobacteraeota bacterium]|nr:hypothetical protein [Candidatus Eremiobacteraeota bacterium]